MMRYNFFLDRLSYYLYVNFTRDFYGLSVSGRFKWRKKERTITKLDSVSLLPLPFPFVKCFSVFPLPFLHWE